MANFSEITQECLQAAGWSPDRRVNIEAEQKLLQRETYPIFPALVQFLESFANLRVSFPHKRIPSKNDEFHFDPRVAVSRVVPERVADYATRVGAELSVIGETSRGYQVLMMDTNGRVFAGFDDLLAKVGDSGEDAVEALCTNRNQVPVP